MATHLLTSLVGWLAVCGAEPVVIEPVDDPSGPPRVEVRPDIEIDLEFVDDQEPQRRGPPGPRGFRREGKNWILSGFELVILADEEVEQDEEKGPADRPPIDLSKGPVKIQLADGREAELRPAARRPFERRFRPPPGDAPMPPEPPSPPVSPEPPMPPGPPVFSPPRPGEGPFRLPSPEEKELLDIQRDLERQCGRLAMRFRQSANDEDRAKIREELAKSLAKLFESRQEMRVRSLGRMKKELERIERSIQEREERKSSLIEQRLHQLIEEPVDF